MIGRRWTGSTFDNAKCTPVDFETSRLEDGLYRGAFVGASGEFVEWTNFLLQLIKTSRKGLIASQVYYDSI